MKRLGFAEFGVELLQGALIDCAHSAEISLDCHLCQRRERTIIFKDLNTLGRCTPTGHTYPGKLVSLTLRTNGALYEFEYDYEPFTDTKYPDEAHYVGFEKGAPNWARFRFDIRCLECGDIRTCSTQTNLGRPWTCQCDCGAELYMDTKSPKLWWTKCEL